MSERVITMMGGNKPEKSLQVSFVGVLITLTFIAVIGFFFIQPYFEARAYERVTGKSVTYWDAMFLDLRVQEPVKEKD